MMFSILWLTEFVLQFVAASALASSSLWQKKGCNKTLCVQTCHLPLHLRLSPSAEDPTLPCTAPSAVICSCPKELQRSAARTGQHLTLPSAGCREPGPAGFIQASVPKVFHSSKSWLCQPGCFSTAFMS